MSLMSVSRSVPAEWMFRAKSTCLPERLPPLFSASCWPRIRIELSGVRSSCDMFARNSDLYFEVSASSAAFSSSARRACSTSLFLRSTSTFCSASCLAFDASSSLVCCSSVCRVCSSMVSCCDCCSRFSVRIVASIVLSTTPIDWVSCSRKVRCVGVNGCSDDSSMTALVSPSNSTGSTTMFFGRARAEAGVDARVAARDLGQEDALLLERALADQALADVDALRPDRRRWRSRRAAPAAATSPWRR